MKHYHECMGCGRQRACTGITCNAAMADRECVREFFRLDRCKECAGRRVMEKNAASLRLMDSLVMEANRNGSG